MLYAFKGGSDGANPLAGLINVNGTLYGTTAQGGDSGCRYTGYPPGCGTVFSVTTSGQETVLYRFTGFRGDGAAPIGGLLAVKGVLYGTADAGGSCFSSAGGCGTVFSITPRGVEKVLYKFNAYRTDMVRSRA